MSIINNPANDGNGNGNGHAKGNGKDKKKTKLTIKQKKFIKALPKVNGNGTLACKIAGYKDPGQAAYENKKKLEGNPEWLAVMDREGLGDKDLLIGLKEVVKATKKTYAVFEGQISDEREDPDYNARHKGIETAFKLRGRLSKEHENSFGQNNLVIILGSDGKPAALDAEII